MPAMIRPSRRRACLLAGLVLLGLAAGASRARAAVDETALRLYAAQGQPARVEAETRRLRHLHPGWKPPADLWTARPGPADEAPLWRLFAADRLDDLDAAIAERRRREPGWQPSPDLAAKRERKRFRGAVLAAARADRWRDVAGLAATAAVQLDADDPDLAWAVAEGLARGGRTADAAALLRTLVVADAPDPVRLVTVQKAMAMLPAAPLEEIVAAAAAAPRPLDLAPVRLDLARARIGAVLREDPGADASAADVALVETQARAAGDPAGLALTAWLAIKRQRFGDALERFTAAMAAGGDAMTAHGLAQTLLALGRRDEAADVAHAWQGSLPNNRILFIDVVEAELTAPERRTVAAPLLARYAQATLEAASGDGAQALGWYAYGGCDFATALAWFERAAAWHPREGTVLGLALTLQRLGRRRDMLELANRYDGLFPRVVELAMRRPGAAVDPCAPSQRGVRDAAAGASAPPPAVARVPHPGLDPEGGRRPPSPFAPGEFPLAVAAENPLRFAAGPGGGRVAVPPAAGRMPLVARRVGGVVAMPYEAFGLALAPGWSGDGRASARSAAEAGAPAGTLWDEQRRRAGPAPGGAWPRDPASARPALAASRFAPGRPSP